MTDAIFQTLQAVLLMCNTHAAILTGPPGHPTSVERYEGMHATGYTPGFEDCAKIQSTVEAEGERRTQRETQRRIAADKQKLQQGLNALAGKPFTPVEAPPQPKAYTGCYNETLTGSKP